MKRRDPCHGNRISNASMAAGIIETGNTQPGIRTLIIPSLVSKSVRNNKAISLMHYTGPKKVILPVVPTVKTTGISYKDACQSGHCKREEQTVAQQSVSGPRCNAVEWLQQSAIQELGCAQTCNNLHVRCSDAPPSHPDIILTTLSYM